VTGTTAPSTPMTHSSGSLHGSPPPKQPHSRACRAGQHAWHLAISGEYRRSGPVGGGEGAERQGFKD
jgi:hypothetical protein